MREYVDFSHIPERQADMHKRLENWANACFSSAGSSASPMFRLYRSDEVWTPRDPTVPVDHRDAALIAKGVQFLPTPHRLAVNWSYISKTSPTQGRRVIGCTLGALLRYVEDGRQMLINRQV